MFDLTGKKVLITGAAGGIGKSIAKIMHQQGAIICLSGTNQVSLEAVKEELKTRVHIITRDLSIEEEVLDLALKAEEILEGVDILVNNAGITKDGISLRMSSQDWHQVISVNLTAPFLLSKTLLSKMMKRKYGRIINISSVVGVMGNAGQVNYSSSKGGLISMTKTLAREFATRGITVNAVAPGYISTQMTDALTEEQKKDLLSHIPMSRMGTPDEVAACIVFLASKEASYITGQTLNINGGMVML